MSDLPRSRRVLVIDDNHEIHADFGKLLAVPSDDLRALEADLFGPSGSPVWESYELDCASQGQEGLRLVEEAVAAGRPYALAFVDMRMPPGWDGVTTIEHIFRADPEIQVVICTAYSEYSWEDIAHRFPASDRLLILRKPFDVAEVCQLAAALSEKWHLARRAHLKRSQLEAMVAEQTEVLRRTNDALAVSQATFRRAAEGARDGLWDWDLRTGRVFYSARWRHMIGCAEDVGHAGQAIDEWFERIVVEDRPAVARALEDAFANRKPYIEIEYRMCHADGHARWMLCRGVVERDAQGQPTLASGSQTDITDRKLAEDQLRRAALRDSLTGLPNRTLLRERIERAFARAARDPRFRYAVLYIDLDRFKAINDQFGHGTGDELLRRAGERVVGVVRDLDTLARQVDDPLSRLGGDEFVLLLEGLSHESDAFRVAERVLEALRTPFEIDGREIRVAATIGMAMGAEHYTTADELLRDGDLALYHGKASGRDRFELFDRRIHGAALTRWQLEGELRAAIGSGQLFLEYQPISSGGGRIRSVEALVRWNHPRLGRVPPNDFIPLAEETGLIGPLGLEVFELACRDLCLWRLQRPDLADLRVAVNVSLRQIEQRGLAAAFAAILARHGLPATCIVVEITESALLGAGPERIAELDRLRAMGMKLHLDDFGTGWSSLSYLRRLAVDALKIDRSFVQAMADDPMAESIVRAILTLAHTFGMEIVAEGVETVAQRDMVVGMGADLFQGWLLGRPVPPDQILALLRPPAMRPVSTARAAGVGG